MKVLHEPGRRRGGGRCAVAIVNLDGSPIENDIAPASYATLPPAELLGAFHSQLVIATNGGWPVSDFTARDGSNCFSPELSRVGMAGRPSMECLP